MLLTRLVHFTGYPGILLISILKPIHTKDGESGISLPTFLLNNRTAPLSVGESSLPVLLTRLCCLLGAHRQNWETQQEACTEDHADCNTITYPFHAVFLHKERVSHKRLPLSLNNHSTGAFPQTFLNLWVLRDNRSTGNKNAEQHEPCHLDVYAAF